MANEEVTPPWPKSYYLRPGYLMPMCMNKKTIENRVKDFEVRQDDVFIITFAKAGTMWMNQIVDAILNIDNLSVLHEREHFEMIPLVEMGPTDEPDMVAAGIPFIPALIDALQSAPSPRRVSTHLFPEFCPSQLFEKKPKCIHVMRHPKDCFVSFFAFHNSIEVLADITWEQYIVEVLKENVEHGSYFDFIKKWANYADEPWVLWIKFEDMKKDPKAAVRKVADFLEKSLTDEQVDEVVRVTSFSYMKQMQKTRKGTEVFEEGTSGQQRKGVVGDWKNWFTVEQSNAFDELSKKKMKGFEKYMYVDDIL